MSEAPRCFFSKGLSFGIYFFHRNRPKASTNNSGCSIGGKCPESGISTYIPRFAVSVSLLISEGGENWSSDPQMTSTGTSKTGVPDPCS